METPIRVHDAQKREFSKRHITKNFIACKLDVNRGFVRVVVQNPLEETNLVNIAIDVYLKLGCNRINYCIENKSSYNLFIQPYNNSTMVSTLNRPGNTSKTTTIEELAHKAELSIAEVNQLIEDSKVSVVMQNGEWVLPKQSAEALIHALYSQKKDLVIRGLFQDSQGTDYLIEEVREEAEQDLSATTAASDDFDSEMKLPENFDIAAGRKRRPDIATGLKIAIESLPGGNTAQGFNRYIVKIMNKSDAAAKDFLGALTGQFPNKKNQEVMAKLKEAAIKFWNTADAEV